MFNLSLRCMLILSVRCGEADDFIRKKTDVVKRIMRLYEVFNARQDKFIRYHTFLE